MQICFCNLPNRKMNISFSISLVWLVHMHLCIPDIIYIWFQELLTRHKSTVADFLNKNYDWVSNFFRSELFVGLGMCMSTWKLDNYVSTLPDLVNSPREKSHDDSLCSGSLKILTLPHWDLIGRVINFGILLLIIQFTVYLIKCNYLCHPFFLFFFGLTNICHVVICSCFHKFHLIVEFCNLLISWH